MYRHTDKIIQTWSHGCTNTLTYRDTLVHQTDRHTDTHFCTKHLHTHSLPHTLTRILTSPSVARALWQLSLTAFHPHPPGGGDVPEGTEVFGPFLSPAGSRVTSTAPLLRPGVPSWVPGPGRRQAQTLRPLLGEQREALLSTDQPLAPTTGSPRGLSSGCAGTWGWGGRGLAEGLSGPGQGGVWAVCGSTDTGHWLKPGRTPYLGSSVAQGSTGLGHSLASPVVPFSAPKKARG